ncbi:MAG: hypothetical protein KBS69_00595 [Bacteroidales bacterium]|nr:hypothetical protein [Candidatus Colicola caccequi]
MKVKSLLLMAMPFALCSCLTHIVTIAPEPIKTQEVVVVTKPAPAPIYTTTITTPKVQTITTTKVTALSQDVSLHLDLQAVGAAFAQSSSVQAFEYLLNNSSYMLSNLDLNRDGYIDYLRVLETTNGYAHVFLIQAVLAPNVFQDVATIVAEVSTVKQAYVQIIGAPYIYGPNYIVQPTYYATPVIYTYLTSRNYKPWRSPWYWNYYPSCFHRPAPQYLNHYQAYVTTYMSNHHYCHVVTYPTTCHYPDYNRVAQPLQRNDYAQQHPEQDFTRRVGTSLTSPSGTTQTSAATQTSATSQTSATTTTPSRSQNASDVRARQAESVTTQTINKSTSRSGSSTSASSASATRSTSATTTATRSTSATPTATRSASAATTVTSRVANSGSARTTISPTPSRSGASTTSTATPSRSRSN